MTTRTVRVVDLKKCSKTDSAHRFSEKRTQEFHAEPGPFCQTQQQEALSENAEGLWGNENEKTTRWREETWLSRLSYVKLVDDMLREIDQDFLD